MLALGSASSFLVYLDATIVNVAFPDIRTSFAGATLSGLSWILSAYGIVFAALLVPAGRLADVVGGRRLFLAGLGAFTTGSLLCALAPGVMSLVGARVLQAAGGALLVPSAQLLIMAAFPPGQRMRVIGVMAGVAALASRSGRCSAASSSISAAGGSSSSSTCLSGSRRWRSAAGCRAGLRRRPAAGSRGLGRRHRCGRAGGARRRPGPVWGWDDPRVLGAFLGAAVLVPVLLRRCRRHPAPALALSLFKLRSFRFGNLGALLLGMSFFGLVLGNALYLTQVWGYSVLTAGLAIAPGPLASAAAAVLAGRFTDRIDPRRFVAPGAVVSALAAVWLATQVGRSPEFVAAWLPGVLLMGIGVGLGFATIVAVCVRDLGPAELGIGSGMSATTRQLGAVFGVAILVAILGPAPAPDAYDAGWWAMGGLRARRRGAGCADRGAAAVAAGHASRMRRARVAAVAGWSWPKAWRRPLMPSTRSVATRRRGRRRMSRASAMAANRSACTRLVTASSSSHSSRRSLAASSACGLAQVVVGVTSHTFSRGSSAFSSS